MSVVDQLCDEFEEAWKRGEPQQIEDVVQQCEPELHAQLLAELLNLEVELRQLAGQQPTMADYAHRFPNHHALIQSALQAALQAAPDVEETVDMQVDQQEVSSIAWSQPASGSSVSAQQSSTSQPGSIRPSIGRYTVISSLGKGGQAEVFRAVHPTLPLEVAIKLTHTTLPEKAREALLQEAHILCDLDHPHIARIRDFDFDDGRPFMVLDFIRGRSLSQVATAQPYSPQAAATVVAKVARAIGFANSRAVIHRDLKPQNVVIDAAGEPKIIDFGMSRLRSGMAEANAEADELSGTLAYMAPEQARGIMAETDHRVDVFALGAILYRLLLGKAPYPVLPVSELWQAVSRGVWESENLNASDAPEPLKQVCTTAMQFEPAKRFATAEDLAAALENWLQSCDLQQKSHSRDALATSVAAYAASTAEAAPNSFASKSVIAIGICLLITLAVFLMSRFNAEDGMASDSMAVNASSAASPEPSAIEPDESESAEVQQHAGAGLIRRFQVIHIGNSGDQAEFSGSLLQFRAPRELDDIQVQAEFSQPVYCYLVAFNPDGVKQLCFPEQADVAQSTPVLSLRYPADEELAFGLTDGTGQQAFVLHTSRDPLPAFVEWNSELLTAQWPNPEVTGNWEYHHGQLQAIEPPASRLLANRGAVRKIQTPTRFKQLCDHLQQAGGGDVRGVLFEVQSRP